MENLTFAGAVENWTKLSSGNTITGQFLSVMKQLADIADNLQKLLGLL